MHDRTTARPNAPLSADELARRHTYWRKNQRLIAILLSVWALVSFGFSILLAERLETLTVGALPMSFWWAQQGAMVVFVILIFVYAHRMDALDREHGLDDDSTDDDSTDHDR